MSFATYILNKVKNNGVTKDGRRVKKANSDYIELFERQRNKNRSGFDNVLYDKKSMKYRAVPIVDGKRWYIGAFSRPQRADVAVRLYMYWVQEGFDMIPRGGNMRNVYHEEA